MYQRFCKLYMRSLYKRAEKLKILQGIKSISISVSGVIKKFLASIGNWKLLLQLELLGQLDLFVIWLQLGVNELTIAEVRLSMQLHI